MTEINPWEEALSVIRNYLDRLGSKVIDVGTGFGILTEFLLKNTNDVEIVSIDPEDWALENARIKFDNYIKIGRLKLYKAYAESIPFPDKYFDSAISMMVMHHLPNPVDGIKEMIRVSKKIVIIVDWKPNAAKIYNPHSSEELEYKMNIVIDELRRNNVIPIDGKFWYGGIINV
jgi:ubiquinone/menaquinone biosynthesis C-methylase UbiE